VLEVPNEKSLASMHKVEKPLERIAESERVIRWAGDLNRMRYQHSVSTARKTLLRSWH
jgi:hypothetical protein